MLTKDKDVLTKIELKELEKIEKSWDFVSFEDMKKILKIREILEDNWFPIYEEKKLLRIKRMLEDEKIFA